MRHEKGCPCDFKVRVRSEKCTYCRLMRRGAREALDAAVERVKDACKNGVPMAQVCDRCWETIAVIRGEKT